MRDSLVKANDAFRVLWLKIRYPVGYTLFAVAIVYGLWHAPPEIWMVQPVWMLLSLSIVVFIFFLQLLQVMLFLRAHNAHAGLLYPALFNARRGVLNTILPARSGTVALLHSLTSKYAIPWRHFLYFFLLSGMISVYVSGIALVWLLWPWGYSALLLTASIAISMYLAHRAAFIYASCLPALLLLSSGLYLATLAVFFCLIRGLGHSLDLIEASYFAIVLNVLAQISITPGNLGIREIVMGVIAPYAAIPASVGIIAGSLLLVVRLSVYGIFLILLEWAHRKHGTQVKSGAD